MAMNAQNTLSGWCRCAWARSGGELRLGGGAHSRGRAAGREHCVPAGALPRAVLLPARRSAPVRSGRAHSRALRRTKLAEVAREAARGHRRFAVRAPRAGPLSQHGGHAECRRSIVGVYRKMHIPDDPLYYEKFYFAPGDLGFQAVDTAFGRSARWSAGTSGIPKARG
jgi:hypothetical protein